ncbi:TPA: DNA gyrase inhibitor SbmC [Salmonella enterica subsp. salamae serovar 35:g,m,s,t:-]|uniref:DNA gyrase inhibitor n=1 Tax=Salmonella enterica subsp. salamae TaxID=59202 RepID=A0A702L4S5_SALER|nr:DNA gyrase inhibitor SbmC [Salmonella enterica subsp. salamae]EIY6647872.1 DNA gyrase inhibitor SbmC [Salmonella enterica]EKR2076619.1 DNA gyrase inhibitor SbmC [Salmonella enterica subsp. salamae serovar 9,46:l,w:e,n,x]HCA3405311.1 DNA gyrase inhibitor SbmC [Salmonella enterica subsp. salamae serovar 35:g,m,s,t:-]EEP8430005.1 DNA gyrase inhibitor SbmC [Salmonella enterica subsp. salamae]
MDYEIRQEQKRKIAGFHMVGPWEQTIKQGFEQLMMWVDGNQIVPIEWIAVYYDNPDEVPAEKLRCDTVVSVAENFVLPDNSEGVIVTEIEGGEYATAVARVENDDFATPWERFFDALLQDNVYQIASAPCFETYLNNGDEDGYWDIEMHIPVRRK